MIDRYRLAVLGWCEQAITAVTPTQDGGPDRAQPEGPVYDLRTRLREVITACGPQESLLDALVERSDFDLVRVWQQAARGAALGEHDLTADVNRLHLPREQMNTVLKDAAVLTQAIVLLDVRYENIPGWRRLPDRRQLELATDACLRQVADLRLDPDVAQRGWRPTAGLIDGPALPGLAGVNQAQHNMLVDLGRHPNALNLRRVLVAQAKLSEQAARHADVAAPRLAAVFRDRAELYKDLVNAGRDVGGPVGGGGYAVAQAQEAILRLQRIRPVADEENAKALRQLLSPFAKIDARISTTIERGFAEKLYAVPVTLRRLDESQVLGVHAAQQRWVPTVSRDQVPLLGLVREALRPATPATRPAPAGHHSNPLAGAPTLGTQMRSPSPRCPVPFEVGGPKPLPGLAVWPRGDALQCQFERRGRRLPYRHHTLE